ncbi:MAG: glycosyl hydrolase, partial [Candidatus Eremiobacteraeota bacterium]|nr:glycosyl hydrolase [Candidatus Eremiobacteraeota bacterium]
MALVSFWAPAAAQAESRALGFGDLSYRWLGPATMGGRLDALAGVPGDPRIIYLAHSSGGLWKSTDGGLRFTSIFERGTTLAVGAVTVDPRKPSRLFIGTGEGFPRNTAAYGDGIWMSADAGKHWKHTGLEGSGSISKIAVDPTNGKIILAAALGEEFAPSEQRGIYRSTDGGGHWVRVLHANATTGGSDVVFDPKNGRIAYAGLFDFLRRPWTLRSGGPGSGLYKSSDSGATWKRLSDPSLHNGLPAGPINRVGVDVCRSDPRVVYAFVPAKSGMLYRSTDAGAHWSLRNTSQDINFRPFYFSQIRCDPSDWRKVFAVAGSVLVSRDGGKSFSSAGGGGDNHDLWIDPSDSRRMLNASDLGFHFSVNGGKSWSFDNVIPFAQVYRVGYDFADPYHVMGGLQDHEVWWGPNEKRTRTDGVGGGDWLNIADWGDGQYAMADPRDPNIVYEDTHFGDLARANLTTGERRYISPQPIIAFGTGAGSFPYRFNWSAPFLISRFDPDVLYFGGNMLFRSSDQGNTWKTVSPDLTHCAPSKLGRSGGPITFDNTNAEAYCTIYSVAEDAKDRAALWIGTDTGELEVTRDGGTSWQDLSAHIPGLPPGSWVNSVSASDTATGRAYAAFDRHQFGDHSPYVFVTADFGRTWRNVSAGLRSYVHVVREDPRNPDVLYAGTETGLFVSLDGGAHWQDFRLGLPHVPVFDVRVHPRDNDLIVGTHARGFYVLDDLAPLQNLSSALKKPAYLFSPPVATRYATGNYTEHGRGEFVSDNKPYGATISFYL